MGILILRNSDICDFLALDLCYPSGERPSGFPMIRWGLGLISPFPHQPPHCSFTPSVPCWGPRTSFSMTSSSQRWLQREESPFSYLNSWNGRDLLQSRPLFHPLSPWIIHYPPDISTASARQTILHVWWEEGLALTLELGRWVIGISKPPLSERGKKVALSHFWKGNGRIGKGKTYRQSRAALSHCRQKLGARDEHHKQRSCIHALKWYLTF